MVSEDSPALAINNQNDNVRLKYQITDKANRYFSIISVFWQQL